MTKWRLELCLSGFVPGDRYGSRIGLAGYPKVVNTQHPLSCIKYLFLSFFLSPFLLLSFCYTTLEDSADPPTSAAKSPSSFLLIGRWLHNTKKKEESESTQGRQWWWKTIASVFSLFFFFFFFFFFLVRFLNIRRSGVLTALAWLMPHETAAISAQVLCTPCHFVQSRIRTVHAWLSVTCHLHLGRMTGIFYVLLR